MRMDDTDDLTGDVCPWCHHVLHDLDQCTHCDWHRPKENPNGH